MPSSDQSHLSNVVPVERQSAKLRVYRQRDASHRRTLVDHVIAKLVQFSVSKQSTEYQPVCSTPLNRSKAASRAPDGYMKADQVIQKLAYLQSQHRQRPERT